MRFAVIVVFVICQPMFAQESAWKAGAAKITITPERPMWMSGYAARSKPAEGKLHDLWAKALVLEAPGGGKLCLVTLDVVGVDRGTSLAICDRLQKKFGLKRAEIVLNCSHTHCGPVIGKNLPAMYPLDEVQRKLVDDYTDFLPRRVEKAVADAFADLAPARLSWAIGQATFAVNRRENKEADVVQLKKDGQLKGPFDHDVPVLAVTDLAGKHRAIVFGYACHATVLSFQLWCGDYPGFAMLEVEKSHPGAVALFWAGCGADQNPLPRRTVELAQDYGRQLAQSVAETLKKPLTPLTGSLVTAYQEIPLAFADLPTRDQLVQDAEGKDKYLSMRAKHLLGLIAKDGKLAPTYPYPVQHIQLGQDVQWVTLGGEVTVEYALRLKKVLAPGKTWVMGYANDVMAYIPSLKVLNEGGYEGARSMIYYGQPTVWGPRIEEDIVTAVKGLRTR